MEDGGAGTSAAKRRRQRRLRSWWRHECQSVRMALNAAAHHSAEKVAAGEKNSGLRAQTSFSARRPGVLEEPETQGGAVTDVYVAASVPSLAVPLLAGAAGEVVDSSTLRFLAAAALYSRKLKEEEVRKREEEEELKRIRNIPLNQLTPLQQQKLVSWMDKEKEKAKAAVGSSASSSSGATKRKRKKRRKRKTPKTSSCRGRPHRRLWQWPVPGWSFWCCSSRCVPVVGIGSGMCWLVLLVTLHLALCSFSLLSMSVAVPQVQFLDRLFRLPMKPVANPQVQLMDKVLCSLLFRLVLLVKQRRKLRRFRSCRFSTSSFRFLSWCRGRFPWSSSGPRCSASWPVWTRRICSACARLGLLGFYDVPRAVLLLLSQAQDARHHGRHGPQDSVEVHRCSSWTRSSTCPLVCYEWRHGPDSAENCLAVPQVLLIITVIFITVVAQRLSLWLRLFCRPSRYHCCQDWQVSRVQAWRRKPCPTLLSFAGADVENTFEIPQLQLVDLVYVHVRLVPQV